MDVAVVIAIVGFAFGAALVQSTIGFGHALLFAPFAALVIGPREPIATSLVTATILSFAVWEHRPRAPMRSIGVLVVARIAGTPLGLILLLRLSEVALHLLVGAGIVISAIAGLLRRGHREVPSQRAGVDYRDRGTALRRDARRDVVPGPADRAVRTLGWRHTA